MVSTPIASDRRWAIPAADVHDREAGVAGQAHPGAARRGRFRIVPLLEDVALLLLVVVMCPLAILIIGAPVVLVVRLLIEAAERI